MDMESRNGASSSRVAVLKKEWTSMFPVPSQLVESYGGVLPSKVTLTCGESEKKWKFKIEKFKDQYFFTDGWKEFEEEVDLESRELLMYRAAGSPKEKGTNKVKRRKICGNAHGTADLSLNGNEGSGVVETLRFLKEMKKYHQYRMDIPNDFVMGTGILKSGLIMLKNSEGREWPVSLTKRANVFSLCGGWFDFLKGNNVVIGSTLSFYLSSSDTIDVQIVEEGTDKQALFENLNKASDHAKVPTSSVLIVRNGNEDHSSSSEEEE